MYKSITEEDISEFINLDYDEFIESILIELVKHSDNKKLLPDLLEHLPRPDLLLLSIKKYSHFILEQKNIF